MQTIFQRTGEAFLTHTVHPTTSTSTAELPTHTTSRSGMAASDHHPPKPAAKPAQRYQKKMTVMDRGLYAQKPYRDLYDRCVQRWKEHKGRLLLCMSDWCAFSFKYFLQGFFADPCLLMVSGDGVRMLASVPDYRQSDVNKSWVCPKDGCNKKYPKPQLMFDHLDGHQEFHGETVHLYTTYQDPNVANPLDEEAIVFKSSTEYIVGSKKRKRSFPQRDASARKSKLNRLAEAAEAEAANRSACSPGPAAEQYLLCQQAASLSLPSSTEPTRECTAVVQPDKKVAAEEVAAATSGEHQPAASTDAEQAGQGAVASAGASSGELAVKTSGEQSPPVADTEAEEVAVAPAEHQPGAVTEAEQGQQVEAAPEGAEEELAVTGAVAMFAKLQQSTFAARGGDWFISNVYLQPKYFKFTSY